MACSAAEKGASSRHEGRFVACGTCCTRISRVWGSLRRSLVERGQAVAIIASLFYGLEGRKLAPDKEMTGLMRGNDDELVRS